MGNKEDTVSKTFLVVVTVLLVLFVLFQQGMIYSYENMTTKLLHAIDLLIGACL